jgi:hypothetical protein
MLNGHMATGRPALESSDVYCLACGYSLRGLERSGRCPECGRAFDLDEPATFSDQPVHGPPKAVGIAIAVAGVAAMGAIGLTLLMLLPYDLVAWPLGAGSVLASLGATVALIVASIWAYRRLKLPMLPWLIAHWIIGAVLSWTAPFLMSDFINHGAVPAGYTLGTFLRIWGPWSHWIGGLKHLLVIIMLMSEAAFVISRMIDERPRGMGLLLAARQQATAFGIALVGLTLLNPLLILLLWLL